MEQSRVILVIDDDPDVLSVVESYLADQDYRVVKAALWTEAIAQIQDAQPDAMLLDLRLPTVQGEVLLEFIRETHPELPVVIISADITPAEMGRLSDLGASGFIRKPFEINDLMVVLEQVLLDLATVATPSRHEEETTTQATEISESTDAVATPAPEPASLLPPDVLPGAGVQDLAQRSPTTLSPIESTEGYRRRRKKKKSGRSIPKLKRLRNFALIVVFFFMIAGILYVIQQGLYTGNVVGISMKQAPQEEQAP